VNLNWYLIDLRPCQHNNSYMDGRSQIKVHTDERTQVHSAQSSLAVTHPSTNQARRYLTSVTVSLSKHWSPSRTSLGLGVHVSRHFGRQRISAERCRHPEVVEIQLSGRSVLLRAEQPMAVKTFDALDACIFFRDIGYCLTSVTKLRSFHF
jgi:hypothetical protein